MSPRTNSVLVGTISALLLIPMIAIAQPQARRPASQVEVTNFPETQSVSGTVQVSNLPSEQAVRVQNSFLNVSVLLPPTFQLVGFSSELLRGDSGVLGFTRACQADFPNSRMCTSEEILNTVTLPDLPVDTVAYVRPVLHGTTIYKERDRDGNVVQRLAIPYDSSGVTVNKLTLADENSCQGWATKTSGILGLTVDSNGSFDHGFCSTARPVACCALVYPMVD